jgi:hypothetical protein
VPIFSSFSSGSGRSYGILSASPPGKPIISSVTDVGTNRAYNNGAVDVTFQPFGTKANTFTVTSSPGGFTASASNTGASSQTIRVTGLQSSTSYTFTVIGTNSIGNSKPSINSNAVTATTVPQAPTLSSVTNNGARTSIVATFTAGANGGKTVSQFTATRTGPASINSSTSPITFTGLTSGASYTVSVTATNENGTSIASNSLSATTFNATGGSTTTVGGNIIHTFSSNGTFSPNQNKSVEYLIVAGGGSGGAGRASPFTEWPGGGGAGGLVEGTFSSVGGVNYGITVGNGGPGVNAFPADAAFNGNTGGNSTAFSLTALGGGGGASASRNGLNGGSGGGASGRQDQASGGSGGSGQQPGSASGGFGNNGGNSPGNGSNITGGSGGGGAAGAGTSGSNGSGGIGGNGGSGRDSSITGTTVRYSAGGAGANGGSNGSGYGNPGSGTQGVRGNALSVSGFNGIVVVRYPAA